jgi:NAD(P)-dependent dehydrogenase (short-subunit alcohol dehydrogenase family)
MNKKKSLVIGGTKGIGKVITSHLKRRGDIVYTASRSSKNKNNIQIDLLKGKIHINNCLKNFFKKNKIIFDNIILCQRYRGIDPYEEFEVSVHSSKYLIDFAYKNKKLKNSIVFISSISSMTIVHDQNIDYHSTRSAINQMTKYYALKLGKKNITSNCIMPTKIIKPENQQFYNKRNNKITKMMKEITPIPRMGKSSDVANLVDFLTSPYSSFLTGCLLPLDGGTRLQSHETIANIYKKF